jgi:hypothetical protein
MPCLGVRGGGGNFGIVVDFQFRLNPAGPTVLAGPILSYVADSPRVLEFCRDWISDAPDEPATVVIHDTTGEVAAFVKKRLSTALHAFVGQR